MPKLPHGARMLIAAFSALFITSSSTASAPTTADKEEKTEAVYQAALDAEDNGDLCSAVRHYRIAVALGSGEALAALSNSMLLSAVYDEAEGPASTCKPRG